MEYVKIKWNGVSYHEESATTDRMSLLGLFLTSDVEDFKGSYSYRKWIDDVHYDSTGGNFSFLLKEGDNIIIGHAYSDNPLELIFKCSKKQLASILDRWDEVVAWKMQEIIITRNGDTFTVEGRGFRDQKD